MPVAALSKQLRQNDLQGIIFLTWPFPPLTNHTGYIALPSVGGTDRHKSERLIG